MKLSKYRTIVADPPWPYGKFGSYKWRKGRPSGETRSLPYQTMSLDEIAHLPIGELADFDSHLYVWTTQRFVRHTFDLVQSWGFSPICLLVWCKAPHGFNPGGTFGSTVEFVLFAQRGKIAPLRREQRQWFEWPRGSHSTKPEAFLDLVEQVSPGPRLELFARRNRLGWDTWGKEALEHVEITL